MGVPTARSVSAMSLTLNPRFRSLAGAIVANDDSSQWRERVPDTAPSMAGVQAGGRFHAATSLPSRRSPCLQSRNCQRYQLFAWACARVASLRAKSSSQTSLCQRKCRQLSTSSRHVKRPGSQRDSVAGFNASALRCAVQAACTGMATISKLHAPLLRRTRSPGPSIAHPSGALLVPQPLHSSRIQLCPAKACIGQCSLVIATASPARFLAALAPSTDPSSRYTRIRVFDS